MSTAPTPQFSPEVAATMAKSEVIILEYESENTTKVIRNIGDVNYRPDPKSKTAIQLAWHIVTAEYFFLTSVANLNFPMDGQEPPCPETVDGVLAFYASEVPKALEGVKAMTPEQLLTPVNFYGMFNYPVFMYLSFATRHSVHHRGQLSAYLRASGGKVPSIYGGSADEPMPMPQ